MKSNQKSRKGRTGQCLCGNPAKYSHSGQYICEHCRQLDDNRDYNRSNKKLDARKKRTGDGDLEFYAAHTVRPSYPENWSCNVDMEDNRLSD